MNRVEPSRASAGLTYDQVVAMASCPFHGCRAVRNVPCLDPRNVRDGGPHKSRARAAFRLMEREAVKVSSWVTGDKDDCRCGDCGEVFTSRSLIGDHVFCPKCGSYDILAHKRPR